MSDNALGGFLRARREAITPAEVGLPEGPRRRVPGLRRAELADLAGISVEYLTRLERGRDRSPSGQVLGALADALRLSPDERVHLYRLVKAATGAVCAQAAAPARSVRAGVRALLDRLGDTPAFVTDPAGDVLAFNAGFSALAAPVGLLDDEPANLARFVFADSRAHTAFPEWDRVADEWAAALRAAADLGERAAVALAEELSVTAGGEFTRRFAASAVLPAWTGTERWRLPSGDTLRLAYESLPLPGTDEHRLVVYLPADASGCAHTASAGSRAVSVPAGTLSV
ncbi:Helix-turn-helix domain-containing protein [Amycolatopsis arida]|uniref:Helix-turn-helix domain-containing protein n=1 Tax=Amycolatopsis arida TaxID=587909 RepID=A0A1I5P8J4_9PSEU|nr:helix-turn-helix domain-containing protein [Amycolatopsis arida]TDX98400.1 helix-turn-helix protein [Amycolatopsis arida]SFP30283.1 Helix-turn-helix domain-containing protein [Amycolatopsis arida]